MPSSDVINPSFGKNENKIEPIDFGRNVPQKYQIEFKGTCYG